MDLSAIPKVELHCHLDGIADPDMLRRIQRDGVRLPLAPEELERAYPVDSLDAFIAWTALHQRLEGDLDLFRPVLAAHMERLRAQHVVYTEIAIGSSELPRERAEMLAKVRAFREFATSLEDGAVQVEFLVALSRTRAPELIEELAGRVIALHDEGLVCGVVVAGLERGYPVRPFARTLRRLREAGLGIEVHAGEWAGAESVRDALDHGAPHRIGHGVAAFGDRELLDRVRDAGIHVEMCPTSNVRTGAVGAIGEHPVAAARDLALSFSINTDDPGAFRIDLDGEFGLVHEHFGFDAADFSAIGRSALAARFQPRLRYPGSVASIA